MTHAYLYRLLTGGGGGRGVDLQVFVIHRHGGGELEISNLKRFRRSN